MKGIPITNNVIADAWLWVVGKNRPDKSREFRMLLDKDFRAMHDLMSKLEEKWDPFRYLPKDRRPDYYTWRHDCMNEIAAERNWNQQTRNLYASMQSVLKPWQLRGQNEETKRWLEIHRPGAYVMFQFIEGFQSELTL